LSNAMVVPSLEVTVSMQISSYVNSFVSQDPQACSVSA
jgi:hypothetical protein